MILIDNVPHYTAREFSVWAEVSKRYICRLCASGVLSSIWTGHQYLLPEESKLEWANRKGKNND